MNTLAKERAAAGAAMLDQKVPGWHAEIDTKHLDMSLGTFSDEEGCGCICAQLDLLYIRSLKRPRRTYGEWTKAFRRLMRRRDERFWRAAANLGFVDDTGYDYADLTEAWRQEVYHRRRADRKREREEGRTLASIV